MKANEFIRQLRALVKQFGNLPIAGGYLHDDTPPRKIVVLDNNGCETRERADAVEFFIQH